ncbi:LysR family transcriptional regulator [Paraburkholderia phenoliruptrix]|uniref:LysR family transcriptional regulator n=1 Tax=Paraburkholderia phenoliruptrix TaxID=252970 RepID=UPI002869CFA8|nr:LysR family transcriptional regulator [Paraburkholderia phenoliruptrix]WMY07557.1 LysR family transcriptional regulator [Paraburkholderia phenoliruptrix]
MYPTIKQLEAFLSTARLGSFSSASESLHTTQSAVSKRVSELEAALSVVLFERSQKRPALTAKGRALMPLAEQVVELLARIDEEVLDPDPFAGRVRIGVTEISALTWLRGFIERARELYPRLTIDPEVNSSRTLLEQFDDNTLDIAVVPEGDRWPVSYCSLAVGKLRTAWVASPSLIGRKRVLAPRELAGYPLLLQAASSVTSRVHETWLREHRVSARLATRTNSLPVLGQLTIAGLGLSVLPTEFFEEEISKGLLVVLDTGKTLPQLDYHALYRRERHEPMSRLTALIKSACDFHRRSD